MLRASRIRRIGKGPSRAFRNIWWTPTIACLVLASFYWYLDHRLTVRTAYGTIIGSTEEGLRRHGSVGDWRPVSEDLRRTYGPDLTGEVREIQLDIGYYRYTFIQRRARAGGMTTCLDESISGGPRILLIVGTTLVVAAAFSFVLSGGRWLVKRKYGDAK